MILAIIASVGLGRFRIDNSLDAWVSRPLAGTRLGPYIVVGFDTQEIPAERVEGVLCALPDVAVCVGPGSTALLTLLKTQARGLVLGADGRHAGILCIARPDADAARLAAQVKGALEQLPDWAPDRFAIAGPAAFAAALNDYSQRRMGAILALITLIGGVLMRLVTGSTRRALASVGAIALSLVILLGAIGWSGTRADMSVLLVPPMMISMGYSYAAHVSIRRDAMRVLMLCALTTILGVVFFGSSGVPSIRAFALWGSAGVAIVWSCVLSLVPGPGVGRPNPGASGITRWYCSFILAIIARHRRAVILLGAIIAVLGPLGAARLSVNPQPLNYFPTDARIVRDTRSIEKTLTGMLPFEIITSDPQAAAQILEQSPLVRTFVDISSLVGTGQHVLWCTANNDDLDDLAQTFTQWRADAASHGTTLAVRGVAAQLLEVRRQMKRIAAISIPSMLLVAAVASGLIARSGAAALAGLIANLLPISLVLLIAEISHLTLQLPTLMVGAIGIGAGVDDTIHILWLRRRCSTSRTLRTCFRPCAGSSLIASVCMAAYMLSPFRPTVQFGALMAIILAFAAVTDLILLPLMLASHSIRPHAHARET